MKCGAVVVAARVSSIPEVAADAACYFHPEDEGSLVSALSEVIEDDNRASELRARGFVRAQRFDWNRAARKILSLYEHHGLS